MYIIYLIKLEVEPVDIGLYSPMFQRPMQEAHKFTEFVVSELQGKFSVVWVTYQDPISK